jgi:hypothetical protein
MCRRAGPAERGGKSFRALTSSCRIIMTRFDHSLRSDNFMLWVPKKLYRTARFRYHDVRGIENIPE